MTCETHDWRVISGSELGGHAVREEQAAWCRVCGALRSRLLTGWGVLHPLADPTAPKVLNLPRVADHITLGHDMRYGETCGHRTADGPCKRPTTHALKSKYNTELGRGCETCLHATGPDDATIVELDAPVVVAVRMENDKLVLRLADRRVIVVAAEHLGDKVARARLGERRVVNVHAGTSVRWPLLEEEQDVRRILACPHEGSR